MDTVRTCTVDELKNRLAGGNCVLIDVREYPEWVEGHLDAAALVPLGDLKADPGRVAAGEVVVVCRSGGRARQAAELLKARGNCQPVVLEGGFEAWKQAGLPYKKEKGPISLERQVRIAAGALVLTGLLVPVIGFLPYVVGAGLIFAGVTNTCAMGLLIARLPWNRRKPMPACAR